MAMGVDEHQQCPREAVSPVRQARFQLSRTRVSAANALFQPGPYGDFFQKARQHWPSTFE